MQLLIQRNIKSNNDITHLLYPDLSHLSYAGSRHIGRLKLGKLCSHSSKGITNQLMTVHTYCTQI